MGFVSGRSVRLRWIGGLVGFWLGVSSCVSVGRAANAGLEYEAYAGRPFGVARLSLPALPPSSEDLETNHLTLQERDGRALYPVFTNGRLRKLFEEVFGPQPEKPGTVTVLFLFTGDTPLWLGVLTPNPIEIDLVPRRVQARTHQRLLERWWREYNLVAQQQMSEGDSSPVVQTYLTSMLGRRLQLAPPPGRLIARKPQPSPLKPPEEVRDSLETLLGVEGWRMAALKDAWYEPATYDAPTNVPLPSEIRWVPEPPPPFDAHVEIEPIARKVPEDFLYLRFGKFSNYIWMSNLMRDYGGDIGSMVTLRGTRGAGDQRIEQQLALPPPASALVEMLAETLIADVAIVGRDLYLDDGAAIGLIFQARNALFGTNLNQHRKSVAASDKEQGATLTTVQLAGREVSFLSTPDNRLRSYYVVDGNFHFVTTSRVMAERFITVAAGQGSLADSAEFKHVRTRLPVSRNDTIFAYLSPAFFRGLLSPHYQVEVARRLRSLNDFQLLELARWAGRAERLPNDEITTLTAAGLLPPRFGRRPDGSGPIDADGLAVDSLRGARGTFMPVPDVPVQSVTRAEAAACSRRTAYFEQNFQQPDPVVFAVRRELLDGGHERLTIDGRVSPLDESKYGRLLSILAPPTRDKVANIEEDVITIQAHVKGGMLEPQIPTHLLYLGIWDALPLSDLRRGGLLKTLRIIQSTPGYLGAWPKPGFLDWLPLGLNGANADPWGYSKLPFGLWRRDWKGHALLAFERNVLETVAPQLQITEGETAAQVRIHAKNLTNTKFAHWVSAMSYQRSRQATLGNIRLLHTLTQQLHVPSRDARDVAQRLLDAELVCPLGGEYEVVPHPSGFSEWRSTRLTTLEDRGVPADYQAPLLGWFRGVEAALIKETDHLLVSAKLDMERAPNDTKLPEPSSFFQIFGAGKKNEGDAKANGNRGPASKNSDPPANKKKNF